MKKMNETEKDDETMKNNVFRLRLFVPVFSFISRVTQPFFMHN